MPEDCCRKCTREELREEIRREERDNELRIERERIEHEEYLNKKYGWYDDEG